MTQDIQASYRILGVEPTADVDQIKAAFRRRAKQVHPDLNGDDPDAAEKYARLRRAFEAANALALYRQLTDPPQPAERAEGLTDEPVIDWRLADHETDGLDIRLKLDVDLDRLGPNQMGRAFVPHRQDIPCPDCQGRGVTDRWSWKNLAYIVERCPRCQGRGALEKIKTISVRLPARIETGAQVRLFGRGKLESGTGRRGDLFLEVADTSLASPGRV